MTFIPSPEQQAIFDAVLTTSDNIAIAALSGTGKTTSLVELSRRLPKTGSKIFCAFNKDIVRELESRLDGTGVSARTFHSIGLGALKKHLNVKELSPQGDKYKVLVSEWASNNPDLDSALLTAVEPFDAEERGEKLHHYRKATLSMFVDLLNFVRLKLAGWDDMQALDDIVTGYALDAEIDYDGGIIELVLSNVQKIMKQAEAQTRKLIIDYTDMIYWAVKWDVRFYQFQWVLVDECQDLSPLQREMIARIVYTRGGRIVLVGDPNQAIYAFAGADSDSFSLSVQRWNCKVLPLTMTRRCASVITQHASLLVPSFRCPDDKPRGKVVWLPDNTLHKHARIGDMVLSRVKAPLVQACLKLIAENIPATILGAEIGKQLVALLEKLTKRKDYTFAGLLECLGAYQNEQVEIAMKKEDEARAEAIRDQCNALKFVIEAYPDATSIDTLNEEITRLFGDDKPNDQVVTLATIHKSKGLEAGRVFLLAPDKLPLRAKNMTAEERQQEDNLDYVARTRAKTELVYITNEKFLKDNRLPAYAQEDFEDKVWDANATPVEAPDVTAVAETEPIVEAVFKPDGMFIEAFSTPDAEEPDFAVSITAQLTALPSGIGLFAVDGDDKMFVARHIIEKGKFFVETINGEYIQETLSLDEALAKMEAFSPFIPLWNEVSAKDWGFATSKPKTVAERRAEKLAEMKADATVPDAPVSANTSPYTDSREGVIISSDSYLNTDVHKALALLGADNVMYAIVDGVKMGVHRQIPDQKYVVQTLYTNGEDNNPVDTIEEALGLMYDFQPKPNEWVFTRVANWYLIASPVEPPFICRLKSLKPEEALFATYNRDTTRHDKGESVMVWYASGLDGEQYEWWHTTADGFILNPSPDYLSRFSLLLSFDQVEPDVDKWQVIPKSAFKLVASMRSRLLELPEKHVYYAVSGDSKMFVMPDPFEPATSQLYSVEMRGENVVLPLIEALVKMDAFNPVEEQWQIISVDEWVSMTHPTPEPTPLAETTTPPPFAKTMHQRLNDLNGDCDPDTGLSADGKTTTMYITTDMQDNFVVYERDYTDQDDVKWSRDYKTKDIVTLISKMQAINPSADEWKLLSWGDWIEMVHEDEPEAESPNMDVLKEEFVDAVRDMVTQMGGVIAGETNTVSLGDQTYAVVHLDDPETPIADALTISKIAEIITLIDRLSGDKATELATKIHQTVAPLLTFVDWTKSNRATIKVAIKRVLREVNYAHNDGIEIVSDELADFYQQGTIETPSEDASMPANTIESNVTDEAFVLFSTAIMNLLQTIPDTNCLVAVVGNIKMCVIPPYSHPKYDKFFVYSFDEDYTQPESLSADEILKKMYAFSPVVSTWNSISKNEWMFTTAWENAPWNPANVDDTTLITKANEAGAVVDEKLGLNEDAESTIEAESTDTPPADAPTFSNGESYTNGKDHSATTTQTVTPPPAPKPTLPLPSTATDTLRALVDQFRAFELAELDLVQQAIEHVRREKTEGVNA